MSNDQMITNFLIFKFNANHLQFLNPFYQYKLL
jgi:hypothetical protein